MEKQKVADAKPIPGRVKKALVAGPHGKAIHTDGSSQASPNPHKPTDGGQKGGMKGL
jgi:hypothetical protein